jgi:hypothetical protein
LEDDAEEGSNLVLSPFQNKSTDTSIAKEEEPIEEN